MKPHFVLNGKAYPLLKRGNADSPWNIRLQVKGVRRCVSTGTADTRQALQRGEQLARAALAGDWITVEGLRPDRQIEREWATVGEVLEAAKTLKVKSGPAYATALLDFLETATGRQDGRRLALTHLTAPLARAYQGKMQGLPRADPEKMTPKNATANSVLRSARCLFSRKARAHYERLGLAVPDLGPWMTVPLLTVEHARYSDAPIADSVIDEIEREMQGQPAQVRRAHAQIVMQGRPPGDVEKVAGYARVLKRWRLTPLDMWHHAAACMYRRSGSLETAAKWAGMGIQSATWHLGQMKVVVRDLAPDELRLGI